MRMVRVLGSEFRDFQVRVRFKFWGRLGMVSGKYQERFRYFELVCFGHFVEWCNMSGFLVLGILQIWVGVIDLWNVGGYCWGS